METQVTDVPPIAPTPVDPSNSSLLCTLLNSSTKPRMARIDIVTIYSTVETGVEVELQTEYWLNHEMAGISGPLYCRFSVRRAWSHTPA